MQSPSPAARTGFLKHPILAAAKGSLCLLAVCTGVAEAQQTIERYIRNLAELTYAFGEVEANPANTYIFTLEWRRDANGNTIAWEPTSPIKLTKGKVKILGSQSNNYPERYIFDGKGNKRLFVVDAAEGYQPALTLSGITVRNGYTNNGGGGGLYANKAYDIQVRYCRFLNNKSLSPGAAIFIQASRNFYMLKSLVDGNENQWYSSCGGGEMGNGGGIAYWSGGTAGYFSLHKSTISNNKGCRGGGIQVRGDITMNMHNNTFSGNIAQQTGGAMSLEGSTKPSYFYHNTLTNNSAGTPVAPTSGYAYGGGVAFNAFNGSGYWSGNVIARNLVGTQPLNVKTEDCYVHAGSPAFVKYTNVVGRISNCSQLGTGGTWGVGTNSTPFDPKLGALAVGTTNDGFALPVHLPTSTSPLRGNYFNPPSGGGYSCPSADERGFARASNGCDIGSVERGADGNP